MNLNICSYDFEFCALLCVYSSFVIILILKRELVALSHCLQLLLVVFSDHTNLLFCLSSCCLMIVIWLFLNMSRVCLQFAIVVFPNHTNLLVFHVFKLKLIWYMVVKYTQ